jgi:hypothetical protein
MSRIAAAALVCLVLPVWGAAPPRAGESPVPAPGKVTVYPAPKGAPVSKDYTVTVGGKAVDVYAVKSVYRDPVSFAYCDISGPVEVTVKAKFIDPKKVRSMSLHPLSMKIEAKRTGNSLSFGVGKPRSITVLVNGLHKKKPLHLFLNPPAEPPPKDAVVFGPGKHKIGAKNGLLRIKSGQTVHIAGGAWVEGGIWAQKVNKVTITGRGVLHQTAERRSVIRIRSGTKINVEGVILTRASAPGWVSVFQDCDGVTARNLHIVVPIKPSTDGLNPCNSRNVTIEDCFFRTGDDCIAMKGNTGGSVTPAGAKRAGTPLDIDPKTQPPVENVAVRRCTFWSEFNNVICIGAETRAKHFRNIRVEDCDVLYHARYHRGYGAFSILPLHGTEFRDITFENIRFEHIEGELFHFKFGERLYGPGIPGFQKFPGGISNVTIKDIFVGRQAGGPRSTFHGWSKDKQIRNVTIQGLRYGETLVRDAKGMGLKRNAHVSGVRFLDPPAKKPGGPRYTKPDPKVGPLWLTFSSGFDPKAGKSSGVRLRLQAWEPGSRERATLLEASVRPQKAWREHAVNLSAYAGRKIVLRFSVGPGVDTRHDWFQWGAPQVVRLAGGRRKVLLDLAAIFEGSRKGVLGWPYGELAPLGGGAILRLHRAGEKDKGLAVGGVRKPGVFMHPAWKDGRREPVFLQWTLDLSGEKRQ